MRRWMLAGNWKMHNTIDDSQPLARAIVEGRSDVKGGEIVVAPVFTALAAVGRLSKAARWPSRHRMSSTRKRAPTRVRWHPPCSWTRAAPT